MGAITTLDSWKYGKQAGYHKLFEKQDTRPVGRVGIMLADMGMPEDYEFAFYRNYINHVFHYMLPPFVAPMVLADRGICLIDPENPLAREAFKPRQLCDAHGSYANKAGKPYVECPVAWHPPGMPKNPWDHGYFIYTEEGKGGASDISQKTGAKVYSWYYGHLLPEKKVAWAYQCRLVYEDAAKELKKRYPGAELRHAFYVYPESMRQAAEELIAAGCQTIIYQSFCNPVYSDFEEYQFALPMLYDFVDGRAKIICADQLGNQPALRRGFVKMLEDRLAKLPKDASVFVILSKHGHPFKKETQDLRGALYRQPLEEDVRRVMEGWKGKWDLTWSNDEYADEYWDPKGARLETHAAYRMAIDQGYDYALELPTEFIAENTDLMIFHAMKKFNAFVGYDKNNPVPYPDWDKPLVREHHEGKTTGIYLSVPVGPYRKYVVEALVEAVSEMMK